MMKLINKNHILSNCSITSFSNIINNGLDLNIEFKIRSFKLKLEFKIIVNSRIWKTVMKQKLTTPNIEEKSIRGRAFRPVRAS